MSPADPGAAVEGVLAANAALYAAVETADLDALSALWVDGRLAGEAVCVHPGWTPIRGRGPVLRSWAAVMAGTDYIQFVLTDVVASVGDVTAVVSLTENMLSASRDTPPGSFAGGRAVATNVLRLVDGRWRFLVHHASPVLTDLSDVEEPR